MRGLIVFVILAGMHPLACTSENPSRQEKVENDGEGSVEPEVPADGMGTTEQTESEKENFKVTPEAEMALERFLAKKWVFTYEGTVSKGGFGDSQPGSQSIGFWHYPVAKISEPGGDFLYLYGRWACADPLLTPGPPFPTDCLSLDAPTGGQEGYGHIQWRDGGVYRYGRSGKTLTAVPDLGFLKWDTQQHVVWDFSDTIMCNPAVPAPAVFGNVVRLYVPVEERRIIVLKSSPGDPLKFTHETTLPSLFEITCGIYYDDALSFYNLYITSGASGVYVRTEDSRARDYLKDVDWTTYQPPTRPKDKVTVESDGQMSFSVDGLAWHSAGVIEITGAPVINLCSGPEDNTPSVDTISGFVPVFESGDRIRLYYWHRSNRCLSDKGGPDRRFYTKDVHIETAISN